MAAAKQWTASELRILRGLDTPRKIQDFLDRLPYNTDDIVRSPRGVLHARKAQCLDGCLFAAAAMRRLGYRPLLLDLRAVNDDDHILVVFKVKGRWGALAKSNTTMLRYRDPVFRTIRELVLSYFFAYFNTDGEMSLREYSRPFDLTRLDCRDWMFSDEDQRYIGDILDASPHFHILPERDARSLPRAPTYLIDACFAGAVKEGLFDPRNPDH